MLRTKVAELEAHIASQANCNPLQMQQDIDDLQVALALNERQMLNMTQSKEVRQRPAAWAPAAPSCALHSCAHHAPSRPKLPCLRRPCSTT